MAHSRIFQLTKNKLKREDWMDPGYFDSDHMPIGADAINHSNNRQADIDWLMQAIEDSGALIRGADDHQQIIFPKSFKQTYFQHRFATFQQKVAQCTLEQFCDPMDAYELGRMIDQKYSFVVYDDEAYCKSLDEFIRHLPDKKVTYWIGGTLDYHM